MGKLIQIDPTVLTKELTDVGVSFQKATQAIIAATRMTNMLTRKPTPWKAQPETSAAILATLHDFLYKSAATIAKQIGKHPDTVRRYMVHYLAPQGLVDSAYKPGTKEVGFKLSTKSLMIKKLKRQ